MKKLLYILIPISLIATTPFETKESKSFDLSVFNTKRSKINEEAISNKKLACRVVCDKKIYKEQRIADAISFYKGSSKP